MMNHNVYKLVKSCQKVLNMSVGVRTLIVSLIVSCSLSLLYAMYFLMQGHAVPLSVYLLNIFAFIVIGVIYFVKNRIDEKQTVQIVDKKWGLHESLLSHIGFNEKGLDQGVYKLQELQLLKDVSNKDKSEFKNYPPNNLFVISLVMLLSVFLLAFVPESDFMKDLRNKKLLIKEISKANATLLKNKLEELEKAMTDEEKALLDKSELVKKILELDEKEDKEEALSELAKIEQELRKELGDQSHKNDLAMMKKLEKELSKEEETKDLANAMEEKDFKKMMEKLDEMEFDEKSLEEIEKDLKKKEELSKEDIEKIKEKMKEKISNGMKSMKAMNKGLKKSLSSKKSSEREGLDGELSELSDAISELDESLDDLEKMGKSEKLTKKELEELLKQCEKCKNGSKSANSKLGKLGKSLKSLGIKESFMSKLMALKQELNLSQNALASGGMRAMGQGGKEAGEGVDRSKSDQKEALTDNGNHTQLKGAKGEGMNFVAVEEAESGTGVSKIKGKASVQEFKNQTETFMNREDIPDNLKGGVKNYFNAINETEKQ